MADTIKLNPNVSDLPAYNAGMNIAAARLRTGLDDVVALASNENPHGCSPGIAAALATLDPSRYSDPTCELLRAALSRKLGTPGNRIVVGNGSEEMIAAVCRAVLRPGSSVVVMTPGFGLHEIEARATGANVVKIPMTADLCFDLDAVLQALREGPSILFISSPSNPVGSALSDDQLSRLIAGIPGRTLLVYDEAYFEYRDPETPDGLAKLSRSGIPYVVLRTFSKAYGLAGLRVGYAVASSERLAQAMTSAKTPFNVNAAAQLAAIAALDDEGWMFAAKDSVVAERDRVVDGAASLGFFVAKSETNFLFIDVRCDSSAAFDHFLSHGVIVKPWKEKGYVSFLRVTIGLPAENDRFLAGLRLLKDRRPDATPTP